MSKEMYMREKDVELGSVDGKFDTVYINIKDWNEIQKKLKALEIIKKHCVDVYCLQHTNRVIEYNTRNAYVDRITILTNEEYELLKEVLL